MNGIREVFLASLVSCAVIARCCVCFAQAVPFADNGTLKMLYDQRMYPQAIECEGTLYIVWRGEKGFPYIISYGLKDREFSKPFMLLTGMENQVNARKYERDHHYSPVLWVDSKGHLHALLGCHGSSGLHLMSERPRDPTRWQEHGPVSESISYPQVHLIHDRKTLVYFRHRGHLGYWTYRISADDGKTWAGPDNPTVDLNAEPQDGFLGEHAGSYHLTRVSADGRTLHTAFVWKVEEPILNSRYNSRLSDHTRRYNLYYFKVDLPSGRAFNHSGRELALPVNKASADRECLVWDTKERIVAVPPSMDLDEKGQPSFLLNVSDTTPYSCRFYFVRSRGDGWAKTPITRTPHYFNACHLDRGGDGRFRAYLVTGKGENVSQEEMDLYGWGERVQVWVSDRSGENWKLTKDLTPVEEHRYQNIRVVSERMILFYGWQKGNGAGTAYLWRDGRGEQ